ncbi:hypothetical protein C8Q76DRAFT_795307 [Earliella scabrosa]|nr:hypothetical protein C8Q76DRAFT_795307 [Earliella scabrosa]
MERNSRDSRAHIAGIDANCEFLPLPSTPFTPFTSSSSAPFATPSLAIKDIFYPEWASPRTTTAAGAPPATTASCSRSRPEPGREGTNFTLACPYTIFAHYWETPRAAGWGVKESIVRFNVRLEERETLWAGRAVEVKEKVVRAEDERAVST